MVHRCIVRFQLYDTEMVGPLGLYGIAQGIDELDAPVLFVGHVLGRDGTVKNHVRMCRAGHNAQVVEDGLIATIHFDPVVTGDPHADELKAFLQREVEELAPMANIHDLRIVPGPTHTNVIFDCAVPADWLAAKDHRANKIPAALRKAVSDRWPDHFCVIQLEPIYAKLK